MPNDAGIINLYGNASPDVYSKNRKEYQYELFP